MLKYSLIEVIKYINKQNNFDEEEDDEEEKEKSDDEKKPDSEFADQLQICVEYDELNQFYKGENINFIGQLEALGKDLKNNLNNFKDNNNDDDGGNEIKKNKFFQK